MPFYFVHKQHGSKTEKIHLTPLNKSLCPLNPLKKI